jgi:hypothetical protein
MVCHIFCSSLSHVGIAVFIQSFRSFYFSPFLHSHRYRQPRARVVFRSLIPFHFAPFHFQGLCFSHPANPCGCSPVPLHFTQLHHHTHTPFPFIRSNTLHSFITSSPCLFQRTVRAKKCAKPAAGSTRPPRSALPVSGALAPLAAARTQRTGFILRSVSLHSHFSLAIHAGSRLFLLFRFKPASPTPTPDHPPLI